MDIPSTDPSEQMTTNEIRTLMKEVQDFLAAPDQTEDEDMRERWRQYCQVCQYINHRLDRTDQLFERGEWLEAVRSAELEPAVMESVAVIDVEARPAWEQLGTDLGWEKLIPIAIESCERLNEAWENRRKLKPLLRQHIRLSICGEEFIGERLATMRELFRRDKFSTFWRDDIQALERVRVPQLLRQLKVAEKERDLDTLRTTLSELQQTEWTLKLTSSMQKQVDSAETELLENEDLPFLSRALTTAMRQEDDDGACLNITTWQAMVNRYYELKPTPRVQTQNLIDETRDAESWARTIYVQRQTLSDWEGCVSQLVTACNQQTATPAEIEALYAQAKQLESQLPYELRNEATVQRAETARNASRKRATLNTTMTVIGVIVGFIAFAFLLVVVGNWLQSE